MSRLRIRVSGVVQGVGFRYYVVRCARQLNLSGWVRNRPDGSVEVEAVGDAGPLNGFVEDLRVGPPGAHISGLAVDRFEDDLGYEGFEIRF
jgi:acylphosphatase